MHSFKKKRKGKERRERKRGDVANKWPKVLIGTVDKKKGQPLS